MMFNRFLFSAAMILWGNVALAEKEKVTLPQLEVDHYPSQIFWLLLTFAILYLLIAKSALPRIHEVVEKRAHRIERDLEQAARYAAQAKQAKDDYELIHNQALQKRNELMARLAMENEAKAHVENGKLDAQIVQLMHKGEMEIEQNCEKLTHNLQSLSAELVMSLSQEITGRTASVDDVAKIIEEVS